MKWFVTIITENGALALAARVEARPELLDLDGELVRVERHGDEEKLVIDARVDFDDRRRLFLIKTHIDRHDALWCDHPERRLDLKPTVRIRPQLERHRNAARVGQPKRDCRAGICDSQSSE